jgi:beta-mannosidase
MKVYLDSKQIEWKMAFAHDNELKAFDEFRSIDNVTNSGLDILGCTVPGNFELDLLKNGIIEDPFYGSNVLDLQKYEDCHIWYFARFKRELLNQNSSDIRSIFDAPGTPDVPGTQSDPGILNTLNTLNAPNVSNVSLVQNVQNVPNIPNAPNAQNTQDDLQDAYLVFEGLDTYANVYLNGNLVASPDNMLIAHKIPVNGLIQDDNEILIHIRPAVVEAKKYEYSVFEHAMKYNYESLYVRKAPHMYGWDIMPRIISAGIWRPVYIQFRPKERIDEIYLQTLDVTHEDGDATLLCNFKINTEDSLFDGYELLIKGECGDREFSVKKKLQFCAGSFNFTVRNAKLWWPEGRGKPSLYKVTVSLLKDEKVMDTADMTLGIRIVKLDRTSTTDEEGKGEFCFIVNGERVFSKGTNWVPADAFHSRDKERIPRILEMAKDLKCNIIRCWGGNVYEDDIFYDLCDQYGIMVWQDFSMACAIYPQSEEFANRIAIETEAVVKRLRQHPCIVLWAGDNECDQSYCYWSGITKNPNQNILTRKVIPEVLRRHDPIRAYLPSSPYIDEKAFEKGDKYLPENHLWGPRNYFKSDYYKKALCHFASEIGYHGCPSVKSIKKFISPEYLWSYKDNKEWLVHATSPKLETDSPYKYRIELMATQIRELFGFVPDNLGDFVKASQISQAEAFKFFIEYFRSRKWRTTGIIWWNLMDGWPQFSDAIVDYYFEKKLAYEYIKLSQQHICVIIKETENSLNEVVVCNDTREGTNIDYEISNIDDGKILLKGSGYAAPDSVVCLGKVSLSANPSPVFYVIRWETKSGKGINHYTAGIPMLGDVKKEDLKSNFARYLEWLDNIGQARLMF